MTKSELIGRAEELGLGEEADLDRLKVPALEKLIKAATAAPEKPIKVVTVKDLIRLGRIEPANSEDE
jgi:hypothetical protein